jgi:hypothetical protein
MRRSLPPLLRIYVSFFIFHFFKYSYIIAYELSIAQRTPVPQILAFLAKTAFLLLTFQCLHNIMHNASFVQIF